MRRLIFTGDPASKERPRIPGASKHGPQGKGCGETKALHYREVVGDRDMVVSEGLKLQ